MVRRKSRSWLCGWLGRRFRDLHEGVVLDGLPLLPEELEAALLALLDYALNRQGNTERRELDWSCEPEAGLG